MIRYAVFDLDKTMTKRGTWGRFVSGAVRHNPLKLARLWLRAGFLQLRYKTTNTERIAVKRDMLQCSLAGMEKADVLAQAEAFAEREVREGLKPGFLRELAARRAAGDRILIASAGACVVVDAIGRRLGIENTVATKLAWDGERVASDFGSPNCYGAGKLRRLVSLLETFDDFDRARAHVTFYSDSHADLPCFEFSDKCVAVNGTGKLNEIAAARGWEIADWT